MQMKGCDWREETKQASHHARVPTGCPTDSYLHGLWRGDPRTILAHGASGMVYWCSRNYDGILVPGTKQEVAVSSVMVARVVVSHQELVQT